MSEARYERTPDGKWHTHATDGTMRCEATQHEVDLMEAAYQLGLQSHPALTPDLLTDAREQVASLIHDEWQKWAESIMPELGRLTEMHGKKCLCKTCQRIKRWKSMFKPYSELPEEIKAYDRPWADKLLPIIAQLLKLQQARPTEQARERIAELIYTEKNKHSIRTPEAPKLPTWEELHDKSATLAGYNERLIERYLKEADQILQLIPFPDEQAIRTDERKEVAKDLTTGLLAYAPSKDNVMDFVIGLIDSLKSGERLEK